MTMTFSWRIPNENPHLPRYCILGIQDISHWLGVGGVLGVDSFLVEQFSRIEKVQHVWLNNIAL